MSASGAMPVLYNAVEQGLLDAPVVSFYFGRAAAGKSGSGEGEVTFGGVNEDHFAGEIVYLPIYENGSWEVVWDAVTIGNTTVELTDWGAMVDTGASPIGLPIDIAEMP